MRDFKAGGDIKIGGNVHIYDSSDRPKFLDQCTNDELYEERIHRSRLLSKERKAKWRRLAIAWAVISLVLSAISLYEYIFGDKTLAGYIIGGGGIAMGLATLKVLDKPNEFEGHQMKALNDIRRILREREVER